MKLSKKEEEEEKKKSYVLQRCVLQGRMLFFIIYPIPQMDSCLFFFSCIPLFSASYLNCVDSCHDLRG